MIIKTKEGSFFGSKEPLEGYGKANIHLKRSWHMTQTKFLKTQDEIKQYGRELREKIEELMTVQKQYPHSEKVVEHLEFYNQELEMVQEKLAELEVLLQNTKNQFQSKIKLSSLRNQS